MAEEDEAELLYDCPLCGAKNSPLKNMAPVPIPDGVTVVDQKIKNIIQTMLYVCRNCSYMVFIYEGREET